MEKFYCKLSTKPAYPSTSSKTYWSILKTFVNGKKVPIIPPLLVNDKFITYLTNFSANNVSLYKVIVLSQNLIRIMEKTG